MAAAPMSTASPIPRITSEIRAVEDTSNNNSNEDHLSAIRAVEDTRNNSSIDLNVPFHGS